MNSSAQLTVDGQQEKVEGSCKNFSIWNQKLATFSLAIRQKKPTCPGLTQPATKTQTASHSLPHQWDQGENWEKL